MFKRLYVGPGSFWDLPPETDLATLRVELETAIRDGDFLTLEVDIEGHLAELTIDGTRLGSFALIDVPVPGVEPRAAGGAPGPF